MNQPPTDLLNTIIFGSLVVLTLTLSLVFTILYHKRKANIFQKPNLNHIDPPEKTYKILSIDLTDSGNSTHLLSKLEHRYQIFRSKNFAGATLLIRQFPIDLIIASYSNHIKTNISHFKLTELY